MTKEDIIWFAGLFDGEGCISIERHRPRAKSGERSMKYRLKVRINMTHLATMDRIHKTFGGSLSIRKRYSKRNEANQGCWAVTSDKAIELINILYPYLFTKKLDADLAIEFGELLKIQRLHRGFKLSDKELEQRDTLYIKMREAKRYYKQYSNDQPLEPLKRMRHE